MFYLFILLLKNQRTYIYFSSIQYVRFSNLGTCPSPSQTRNKEEQKQGIFSSLFIYLYLSSLLFNQFFRLTITDSLDANLFPSYPIGLFSRELISLWPIVLNDMFSSSQPCARFPSCLSHCWIGIGVKRRVSSGT